MNTSRQIKILFPEDINLTNPQGDTTLHIAAKYSLVELAKKCIEKKADVNVKNKNGQTPLHIVSSNNGPYSSLSDTDVEIIRLLLEAKADANIGKYTKPLHLAAKAGSLEALKLLLPATSKEDQVYDEEYINHKIVYKKEPWYISVMFDTLDSKNWLKILILLKENGANLNQCDCFGYSLLMKIVSRLNPMSINNKKEFNCNIQKMNFLLDHNVALDHKNNYNKTALDILFDNFKSKKSQSSIEFKQIITLFKRELNIKEAKDSYLQKHSFLKLSPSTENISRLWKKNLSQHLID